jgi:endonuclease/exonuclease/phosphatase family metal-dependent hydrolase
MPPSKRRRTAMRVWFALTALLFLTRFAEQAKPYFQAFVGAQERSAAAEAGPGAPLPTRLRLASWNLEWLDEPGRGPVARARKDYARLAHYAARLDADVIAVQEVASELALALVFPPERYAFHLASPGGSQRSGFVYKRSLPAKVHPDLTALAGEGLRAGADLGVMSAQGELRLLSLHLKAFCVTGPLDSKDRDCQRLKAQLPALEAWVDERARSGAPFAVLGDFNRTLEGDADPLWRELDDGDPKELRLVRATPARKAQCTRKGRQLGAVDHVLLGGPATQWLRPHSFRELTFAADDVDAKVKLSDHCPLVIELSLPSGGEHI